MQIRIIAIGQKMPAWVEQGAAEYLKRMPREIQVELIEIPLPSRKSRASVASLQAEESKALQIKIQPGDFTIALDEHGQQWSSKQWGAQLEQWMQNHPRVNFLIGGPDGLAAEIVQQAQQVLALGRLTMPHPLVRIVLCEQLYRAWSIVKGHPYHRE